MSELKVREESWPGMDGSVQRAIVTTYVSGRYAVRCEVRACSGSQKKDGEPAVTIATHAMNQHSIADAKAFHAALGKAIEIAEGYQQELDNAHGS